MIQNTTHLEEYAVPVPATASDFGDELYRRGVRPSGRVQRAASVAAAAAAVEIHELDANETSGSNDSEGSEDALEYSPSPSDSLSSNPEVGVLSRAAESAETVGVRGNICRPSSTASGAQRGLPSHSNEDRRSLPSRSRSATASSMAVQGTPAVAVSRSGHLLQPKVELDEDDFVLDRILPISTPLPRKRASTPCTPTKARGSWAFTPDDNPTSDGPPLSSPLPPKRRSASARTTSRSHSHLSGSSSASSRASSRTATPSSASTLRASTSTHVSQDATPPPSSIASSASTPDRLWTPMSRMSSLSPTPSEVIEQWVRKVSSRTVPSSEDAVDATDRVVVTAWFESSSGVLLDSPPDLLDHPDLQLGDLFYHRTPNDYQLWIWEVSDDNVLGWVSVKFMSVRNGLYLTLTPGELRPSWVSQKYALSRKRDLLRQGYTV